MAFSRTDAGHSEWDNLTKLSVQSLPHCRGRVIVIGDIHGCLKELKDLLHEARYCDGVDCVVCVGDLVSKGPNSVEVVQFLCSLTNCVAIMGNHDFTLLQILSKLDEKKGTEKDPIVQLAFRMPAKCVSFLQAMPHILKIPQHNAIVVHAYLDATKPLEQQDLHDVLHARRVVVDSKGIRRAVSKGSRGVPWVTTWEGPQDVIFGHDAKAGLQLSACAIGIDTGCVYGERLTAYVLPDKQLVAVPGWKPSNRVTPATLEEDSADDGRDVISKLVSSLAARGTPSPLPVSVSSFPSSLVAPPPLSASPNGSVAEIETSTPECIGACAVTITSLCQNGHLAALKDLMSHPLYKSAWASLMEDPMSISRARACDLLASMVQLARRCLTEDAEKAADVLGMLKEALCSLPLSDRVRTDVSAFPVCGSLSVKRTIRSLQALTRD